MKFKIGDKVRIRKDLKEGDSFEVYVTDRMEEFAGKIVTITKAWKNNGERYEIKEDMNSYTWSEDMFENSTKPTKEELLAMPIGTIIKTDREKNNVYIKVGKNDFCNDYADHIEDVNIEDDLTINCDYYGNKIAEIQEPTYNTIYKADKEVKEMTIAEIEKELGYPIKVIKED